MSSIEGLRKAAPEASAGRGEKGGGRGRERERRELCEALGLSHEALVTCEGIRGQLEATVKGSWPMFKVGEGAGRGGEGRGGGGKRDARRHETSQGVVAAALAGVAWPNVAVLATAGGVSDARDVGFVDGAGVPGRPAPDSCLAAALPGHLRHPFLAFASKRKAAHRQESLLGDVSVISPLALALMGGSFEWERLGSRGKIGGWVQVRE